MTNSPRKKPLEDKDKKLAEYAYKGDLEGVRDLLELGANVNVCVRMGFSIPNLGANVDVVDYKIDDTCQTPLGLATFAHNLSMMELLLQNGAKVVSEAKVPAIFYAVQWQSKETLELLLDPGASPDAVHGDSGEMLIAYAIRIGNENMVETLVESGANVNSLSRYLGSESTATPLSVAIYFEKYSIALYLMQQPTINVDVEFGGGRTAIYVAIEKNKKFIVEELLRNGADIKHCAYFNEKCITPITVAFQWDFDLFGLITESKRIDIETKAQLISLMESKSIETQDHGSSNVASTHSEEKDWVYGNILILIGENNTTAME